MAQSNTSTSRCGNICERHGFSNRKCWSSHVREKLWTATHFMDDRFVNLGEEVILALLWAGASELATVCFVISWSICYWLFKCVVLRVVCACVCVLTCVRGRHSHTTTACVLQTHMTIITVSVTWLCPTLRLELMVKTMDIINCLYFYLDS